MGETEIEIIQLTASLEGDLYGLTKDGGIYFYHWKFRHWVPMSRRIEPAPGDSGAGERSK